MQEKVCEREELRKGKRENKEKALIQSNRDSIAI